MYICINNLKQYIIMKQETKDLKFVELLTKANAVSSFEKMTSALFEIKFAFKEGYINEREYNSLFDKVEIRFNSAMKTFFENLR